MRLHGQMREAVNAPCSATRPAGRMDCNHSAMTELQCSQKSMASLRCVLRVPRRLLDQFLQTASIAFAPGAPAHLYRITALASMM
jgi:hypothetical protein